MDEQAIYAKNQNTAYNHRHHRAFLAGQIISFRHTLAAFSDHSDPWVFADNAFSAQIHPKNQANRRNSTLAA